MKTAISIPDELFRAAERAAERMGLTRSELYRRALGAYLEVHDDDAVTRALDAVYSAEPEASQVDSALARLQSASLESGEW